MHTAYVEEISITTNTPPESYIWTLGVLVASITFMCPIGGFLHTHLLVALLAPFAS